MKYFLIISILLFTAQAFAAENPKLSNSIIAVEYNSSMYSTITSNLPDTNPLMDEFYPSEQLILAGRIIKDFKLTDWKKIDDADGEGLLLLGNYSDGSISITKKISVRYTNDFPGFLRTKVTYTNSGNEAVTVTGWINNYYNFIPLKGNKPPYWSYQGATYPDRRDWVQPVAHGFQQENYMGMNASDYGGGTPVADLWRPDIGIAAGHLENSPRLVSIPVNFNSPGLGAALSVSYKFPEEMKLGPGGSFETYETFVSVHKGDYFTTLSNYSRIMQTKGIRFEDFTPSTYQPEWCAWGYERNFTIDEVLGTLPKVAELGYEWATLDDGWQTSEGDWFLNPQRFPNGDADMKNFVNTIHQHKLKAMLWWSPIAVDPGTNLIKQHPDFLLLNKDGSKQDISWWDSYYMCPAYEPVIEYHKNLVRKIIGEWGYDGLKIDGQHLNGAPPCYNEAHHHSHPEESAEMLPLLFKAIIETALSIKPDAVIQICPCGTSYSFFNLPYMNQTVSSDPESSWQIRLKGKTLKALMGCNSPYFGDHVELSDSGNDFASTVGIGGIVGTKFTYPTDRLEHKNYVLTPEKEITWKKWLDIYKAGMLPEGCYRGELYDIGYDKPETHVIQKDDTLFYAFYADSWNGKIELRGLSDRNSYKIIDYVKNTEIPLAEGTNPAINCAFEKYLLIKAVPIN
jgi:alpha-galactosidase